MIPLARNPLSDADISQERRFFDSGDFAMSKASNDSVAGRPRTGKQHPIPGDISNLSSPVPGDSNVESDANASHHQKLSKSSESGQRRDSEKMQSSELAGSAK